MSPFHDRELADVLQAEAARRTPRNGVATPHTPLLSDLARTTPRWQRLRAAIADGHPTYIDPDDITDRLWLTLATVPDIAS